MGPQTVFSPGRAQEKILEALLYHHFGLTPIGFQVYLGLSEGVVKAAIRSLEKKRLIIRFQVEPGSSMRKITPRGRVVIAAWIAYKKAIEGLYPHR